MERNLFIFVFIVAFGGTLLEMLAYYRFWPRYWRAGLVIFKKSYRYSRSQSVPTILEKLERSFPTYGVMQVGWKQLGENEIAFVERRKSFGFGLAYSPVMRGLVRIDPVTQSVEVTGKLQWYFLLLLGAFGGVAVGLGDRGHSLWFFAVVFAVVAVISFIAQRVLYGRIANSLRDLMQAWD
jgi:hypothetical protein